MERDTRIHSLTEQDVTAQYLLPHIRTSSSFFYAILLMATLLLSILSVILFS